MTGARTIAAHGVSRHAVPPRRSDGNSLRRRGIELAALVPLLALTTLLPREVMAHAQATTTVQFDREIVRILNNHCVMCHMEKGPAFPLVTYEQTYAARWKIRQSVLNRHVTPWAAVRGYGDFANANSLTQREIDFLVSWAESYGPRNNGAVYTGVALQTPSKPVQARTELNDWALGKPDVLLSLPANTIEPQQPARIQRTIIATKLKSDRWLRGLEYQPGDRRVVHAVSFSIQESGEWIGSWSPWQGFVRLPDGLSIRLPAASHIVAEIHYSGSTQTVVDKGSLGLYYAERPSTRTVSNLVVGPKPMKLTRDTNILALQPTLQAGVQSIEVSARAPGGATRVLLFAKDIPLEWPTPYVYRQPVSLPQGAELFVTQHYAKDSRTVAGSAPVTFSIYEGAALAPSQPQAPQPRASASTRRFQLKGTVQSVDTENGRLVVDHEAIPGLMGAMSMAYSVGQREQLKGLSAGDEIRSDVVVTDTGSHLENIVVTARKQ
jgi:Cu/Ag efflux protein CusF/cytochrome c5